MKIGIVTKPARQRPLGCDVRRAQRFCDRHARALFVEPSIDQGELGAFGLRTRDRHVERNLDLNVPRCEGGRGIEGQSEEGIEPRARGGQRPASARGFVLRLRQG